MFSAICVYFSIIDLMFLAALRKTGLKRLAPHLVLLIMPQVTLFIGYAMGIQIILLFTASVLTFLRFYEFIFIVLLGGLIIEDNREVFGFALALSIFVSFHYFLRFDYLYVTWELLYRVTAVFMITASAHLFRILFIEHKTA